MDYSIFLPRRITQAGCTVAGTQLATQHDVLKKELKSLKLTLSNKVEVTVLLVLEKSKLLETLPSSDVTMMEIDRGTDRCIAGIHDQLDAIQRSFDHGSLLPLTGDESARLEDASLVRGSVLPGGTAFLKLVYKQQWAQMSTMMTALAVKETAAAVKRLGLAAEVGRLGRWMDLYGAKLGLTEVKLADPAVAGVQEWHDAYGELFAHVHSEYNDRKNETHAKIASALLSPYLTQADEERRVEQKSKAKRDKGTPPAPATP